MNSNLDFKTRKCHPPSDHKKGSNRNVLLSKRRSTECQPQWPSQDSRVGRGKTILFSNSQRLETILCCVIHVFLLKREKNLDKVWQYPEARTRRVLEGQGLKSLKSAHLDNNSESSWSTSSQYARRSDIFAAQPSTLYLVEMRCATWILLMVWK